MTHPIDAAPSHALELPLARWLVEHSTPCPTCRGPRDSHAGCDYCRERVGRAARLLISLGGAP